jgi:simple sugar transport system substrate-binding protein/rhamnose transport system substrate-binding protein
LYYQREATENFWLQKILKEMFVVRKYAKIKGGEKKMKKFIALLLSFMLVFVASTQPAAEEPAAEEPAAEEPAAEKPAADDTITVVIMPKLIGIPYFNAAEKGAKACGEEFGFEVIYTGPTEADATEQAKMLENYISQGVDAICVAPNDPAGIRPTLEKAKKAGITVLDWDTPADKDVVDYSINQIDDQQLGEHMFRTLFEEMEKINGSKEGKYALLTGGLEAANLNTWIDYGLAMAEKEWPGMELVTDKIATNEKQQEAYQKTLELLKAYPDITGIQCQSSPTVPGAAQAIQELGLQDKVAIVGHGLPNDSAPYLKDGSADVAILWDVEKLGYLIAYIAYAKVSGMEIADQMAVPNVGNITLRADGKTIVMGPAQDFTAENVDQFDF